MSADKITLGLVHHDELDSNQMELFIKELKEKLGEGAEVNEKNNLILITADNQTLQTAFPNLNLDYAQMPETLADFLKNMQL